MKLKKSEVSSFKEKAEAKRDKKTGKYKFNKKTEEKLSKSARAINAMSLLVGVNGCIAAAVTGHSILESLLAFVAATLICYLLCVVASSIVLVVDFFR